ncbi:hypothetical protein MXB_5078, partial [Myxobolus squamalis]
VWDQNICIFFAAIVSNIHGIFLNDHNIKDLLTIQIFLRFVEIYVFILKNWIGRNSDSHTLYDYTYKISLNRIKDYLCCYPDINNEENVHIQLRIHYVLALTSNVTFVSILHLKSCLKYLKGHINLFSIDFIITDRKCVISSQNINKLISSYTCGDIVKKTTNLYENKDFIQVFILYEKKIKNNLHILMTLSVDTLFFYLKLLFSSYVSLTECNTIINAVTDILELTIFIKKSNIDDNFVISENDLIVQCFDKLIKSIKYFDDTSIETIFESIVELFYEYYQFENSIFCVKLLHILSMLLFKKTQSGEFALNVAIFAEYAEIIHFYLIKKKICCTDAVKPVIKLIINQFQILTSIYGGSSILDIYFDTLFFCLVGFPNLKKLSSIEYIKDHLTTNDKSFSLKNLPYYQLAYDYYRPTQNCSYVIITESTKYFIKKPLINMEFFKYLSIVGNGIAEYVKNVDNITILEISQKYESCLNGSQLWPKEIIDKNVNLKKTCLLSHNFDFSIFHSLSDYCLKTSSFTSTLRWSLLGVATLPHNYLSWWSCASYVVLKIEDEIISLKCLNKEFTETFSNLIFSAIFCYERALFLLADNNSHKVIVMIDYAWFCFNIAFLLSKDYKFHKNSRYSCTNLYMLAYYGFNYVCENEQNIEGINYWICNGLVFFQHFLFRGTAILFKLFQLQKDTHLIIHLCSCLAKERTNIYLLDCDRDLLMNQC